MDKSDIFTAELILIFSLVIDISRYFHCRVWITSDVSIHLTSLNRGYSSFWSEYEFYFIEWSENILYFMSAEGTNEIYNFSLHEMK